MSTCNSVHSVRLVTVRILLSMFYLMIFLLFPGANLGQPPLGVEQMYPSVNAQPPTEKEAVPSELLVPELPS